MSKNSLIFALAVAVLVLFGMASEAVGSELPKRLKVVTTIFPAYDFARAVAGDKADLSMLVLPGSEVHTFDPSPRDVMSIRNSDVFICIGGASEAWVDTLLKSSRPANRTILRLIDHVSAVEEEQCEHGHCHGHAHEHEHEHEEEYDEHIWTSPNNAVLMVAAVAEALCEADPSNADFYRLRAAEYANEISALGEKFQALVASAKRKKIVFGDRFPFRHFADEFGLEYRAVFPGCSTESDISAVTMADLVRYVKSEGIPVVYTLELGSGRIAAAIAEHAGAEVLMLHSCQNVTKSEFESGATYVSLMRQNLENLRKGLN